MTANYKIKPKAIKKRASFWDRKIRKLSWYLHEKSIISFGHLLHPFSFTTSITLVCRRVCFHYFMIINFHARFMNLASNSSLTSTGVISVLLPPESREPWQNNPFYELINTSFFSGEKRKRTKTEHCVNNFQSRSIRRNKAMLRLLPLVFLCLPPLQFIQEYQALGPVSRKSW